MTGGSVTITTLITADTFPRVKHTCWFSHSVIGYLHGYMVTWLLVLPFNNPTQISARLIPIKEPQPLADKTQIIQPDSVSYGSCWAEGDFLSRLSLSSMQAE